VRTDAAAQERRYLVRGEVRTWSGETQAIEAAACLDEGGVPKRPVPGHVPNLGEAGAMEALRAAREAYG